MTGPRITVVMAVHNGEKYLREAIESVLGQTLRDFEFIIVDDASTDSSLAIIRDYDDSRIRLVRNEQNLGLTRSLNKAIKLACGEYVARQDADDVSLPSRFQEQLDYLEKHPQVAVLGTGAYNIDESGAVIGKMVLPEDAGKRLLRRNQLSHGSVMVRKAVLENIGGYNEFFRYGQDYELWLRISRQYPVRNLRRVLYKLRSHKESISMSKRADSLLYHLLAIRLARGAGGETPLQAAREKGLGALHAYLSRRERAFFHKELAGTHMALGDIAGAREHYREAFRLRPLDLYNVLNLATAYAGRWAWSRMHRTYDYLRDQLW